jgi:hypothetical protein
VPYFTIDEIYWTLLKNSPQVVVWLIGIGIAIKYRKRYPAVTKLTIFAIVLVCLQTLLFPFELHWAVYQSPKWLDWVADRMNLIALVVFGHAGVEALSWAFVLLAIFGWRGRSGPKLRNVERLFTRDDPTHTDETVVKQ